MSCGPFAARWNTSEQPVVAHDAGEFFFLLDERLKVGTEGYSASLLGKIEYAGANEVSFGVASAALARLADLPISAKHVERVSERLGRERAGQRDADVASLKAGRLKPLRAEPPQVVAVHLDAGKVQVRADDGRPGVRNARWSDTKVACFQTYTPVSGVSDPQPDPPAVFLDPPRVMRLCREMERIRGAGSSSASSDGSEGKSARLLVEESPSVERPRRLVRTAVATAQPVAPFGWMVAAEAMLRGFYGAVRKAIVGDGGNWIGPLGDLHFPGWVQVLDFLHLLVHLYAAATSAHRGKAKAAWRLYSRLLRCAWAGEVETVLALLHAEAERLGAPPAKAREDDPRRVVSLTLGYVKTHAGRMDYARYRREGLPITSALVESLIKQFNYRVKGSEKFWLVGGAEAVLQSRAAHLSEDDRAARFYDQRPRGPAVGKNRRKPAA